MGGAEQSLAFPIHLHRHSREDVEKYAHETTRVFSSQYLIKCQRFRLEGQWNL